MSVFVSLLNPLILVPYVNTTDNLTRYTDFFTKALAAKTFYQLRIKIMNVDCSRSGPRSPLHLATLRIDLTPGGVHGCSLIRELGLTPHASTWPHGGVSLDSTPVHDSSSIISDSRSVAAVTLGTGWFP